MEEDLLSKSPYSERVWESKDQENFEYRHLSRSVLYMITVGI